MTLGGKKETSATETIKGYQPIFSLPRFKEALTAEYEIDLLGKLSIIGSGRSSETEDIESVMDRILANCHFYSIHELKSDPGLPI